MQYFITPFYESAFWCAQIRLHINHHKIIWNETLCMHYLFAYWRFQYIYHSKKQNQLMRVICGLQDFVDTSASCSMSLRSIKIDHRKAFTRCGLKKHRENIEKTMFCHQIIGGFLEKVNKNVHKFKTICWQTETSVTWKFLVFQQNSMKVDKTLLSQRFLSSPS